MKSANVIDANLTFWMATKSDPRNWIPASSESFNIETS